MLPILRLDDPDGRARVDALLARLRLDPRALLAPGGDLARKEADVRALMLDVADRGDAALVDHARRFGDADFAAAQLRVSADELANAHATLAPQVRDALCRAVAQVTAYQNHLLPRDDSFAPRPGVTLDTRHAPVRAAGLYVPGGRASYPSSLVMTAVPARVAGVGQIVVCTPPGRSTLVLAAAHLLGVNDVFRIGGASAIAALAFGTETVPKVDKIVGPGNLYVQLAKRLVSGAVGVDGFAGPSEIVVIADGSAEARFVAADLLAQAEHDPGSCFLLTDDDALAAEANREIARQAAALSRRAALDTSFAGLSAIVVGAMDALLDLANELAAEHVSLQLRDPDAALARLRHAGAVFVGPHAPVAAGDYVAGPSHCLPTNTTARFASGLSVFDFLKRASVERYDARGLADDAPAIVALAEAEGLDAHAASVRVRFERPV